MKNRRRRSKTKYTNSLQLPSRVDLINLTRLKLLLKREDAVSKTPPYKTESQTIDVHTKFHNDGTRGYFISKIVLTDSSIILT